MELVEKAPCCWEIVKSGKMAVPGRIFTSREMLQQLRHDDALQQVCDVAALPGIVKASLAMPDAHCGYGFPIGGVAAFDWREGIVSPGGVGYDINCGVRLAGTALEAAPLLPRLDTIADALYRCIPAGVGTGGAIRLTASEEKKVLRQGSAWAVRQGYGEDTDIRHTEDGGCLSMADPAEVSPRALERGRRQLGTLGAGNHFVEIGVVDRVFRPEAAAMGLYEGQLTVMLHCGSRGLGYQVCDDFLALMKRRGAKKGELPPNRQLTYARLSSATGQRYLRAMACAANYAWANRQVLMHLVHEALMRVLGMGPRDLGLRLVYDLCHNIAKRETHEVDGRRQTLCVHRKGATRSFPAGHPSLGEAWQSTGQPVIIPGDMGTASYVLVGTRKAMELTFGSTCHGAGRVLSRTAARRQSRGRVIHEELRARGIRVRWTGRNTLAEEMPEAYKNISHVVDTVEQAGISLKVARLRPLVVIKG